MKCNIKKAKRGCVGLMGTGAQQEFQANHKCLSLLDNTKPQTINLNEYLYHAVGAYLQPYEKIGRLRAIVDSGAILCENMQSEAFEFSNSISQSPKCNGIDEISICQRQSFVDLQEISDSFKLYVANGVSVILKKSVVESLNAENKFDPNDRWEWLDGSIE